MDSEPPARLVADDPFVGKQAEDWMNVIGARGDPVRQVVVNRVIAAALDRFAPISERSAALLRPQGVIREALAGAGLSPVNVTNLESLFRWQDDAEAFRQCHGQLAGACLWDLGCGNGYLGHWLSPYGVQYVGVEPGPELAAAAEQPDAAVFNADIVSFLRTYAKAAPAPTLVTIVSVLEHCGSPQMVLAELAAFLTNYATLTPILVTTLDPAFFSATPPRLADEIVSPDSYGGRLPLRLRDPASWEIMFADAGLHVLEQRPMNLATLPDLLADDLHDLHRRSVRDAHHIVPPAQGPFYFWLLAPRRAAASQLGDGATLAAELRHYAGGASGLGEAIEVVGNLGALVHTVEEGCAVFDSDPAALRMAFAAGDTFGQMELKRNYASGRMLGHLFARGSTTLKSVSYAAILDSMRPGEDLRHELFLSMLGHIGKVRFKNLLSARRVVTSRKSAVLGNSVVLGRARNYAALLLQKWSDQVEDVSDGRYRSRVVLEIADNAVVSHTLGDDAAENDDFNECIPAFVQNHIVDCFSIAKLVALPREGGPFQDKGYDLDLADMASGRHLHLGMMVALKLDEVLHFRDDDREDGLQWLALMVSTLLGCKDDDKEMRKRMRDDREAYLADQRAMRDRGEGGLPREAAARRSAFPYRKDEMTAYIVEECRVMADQRIDEGKLTTFLDSVRDHFPFNVTSGHHTRLGLCELVVVRDIWALIAVVLDEPKMWKGGPAFSSPGAFLIQPNQRSRIITYFHECIGYLAAKAGLSVLQA